KTRSPTPVAVAGLSDVIAVAAGGEHSCALRQSGRVSCWGQNLYGQLGNGAGARELNTPLAKPVGVVRIDDAVEIGTGLGHGCARRRTGQVLCWGRNDRGQLGAGVESNWSTRVPVKGISSAADLSVGSLHTCVALSDGSVQCWGDNRHGQLGRPSGELHRVPVIVPGIRDAIAIASGDDHTCALQRGGT